MTLQECQDSVGRKVIYNRQHCPTEYGVITSVNSKFAFVRYGTDTNSKATGPEDLTLDC